MGISELLYRNFVQFLLEMYCAIVARFSSSKFRLETLVFTFALTFRALVKIINCPIVILTIVIISGNIMFFIFIDHYNFIFFQFYDLCIYLVLIMFWISLSVVLSIFDVASSNTRIRFSSKTALARQISCR